MCHFIAHCPNFLVLILEEPAPILGRKVGVSRGAVQDHFVCDQNMIQKILGKRGTMMSGTDPVKFIGTRFELAHILIMPEDRLFGIRRSHASYVAPAAFQFVSGEKDPVRFIQDRDTGQVMSSDLKDLQLGQGQLLHLATLEFDEKTYMALGSVTPFENGAQISVMMVREQLDNDGVGHYEIVKDRKEISEIVPRLVEAFAPDAEFHLPEMDPGDFDEEDSSPFIFDCSGMDEYIS